MKTSYLIPRCARSRAIQKTTAISVASIIVLSPAALLGAPGDELRGEQQYNILGVPETSKSFWDPSFWRDTTPPLEAPIVPGTSNFLYFGSKAWDGQPYAQPATGLTLYTAAHSGFTPPGVPPVLARILFLNDRILFDGTPAVSGNPLGRLVVGSPHPIQLENESQIDFDRTVVNTNNILLFSQSSLTITGDVTTAGGTYNLRNPGTTSTSRSGANASPILRVRNGAIVELNNFMNSYTLHPTLPNTGNASAIKLESGCTLSVSALILNNPAGVVVDSVNSLSAFAGVSCTGGIPTADPLVLFKAGGAAAGGLSVSNLTVSGPTSLTNFTGTFADGRDGASMIFRGRVTMFDEGNQCNVFASSNANVQLLNLATGDLFTSGTALFYWQATTGGQINTSASTLPLRLHDGTHQFRAFSGGKVDLPTSFSVNPSGNLRLIAADSDSVLNVISSCSSEPYNVLTNPTATWGNGEIILTNGAKLRGGGVVDVGGGNFYPDMRGVYVHRAGLFTMNCTDASVEQITFSFSSTPAAVNIGSPGHPAQLKHVDFTIGDGSALTVNGGTWQPSQIETASYSQFLQLGDTLGNSHCTISNAAQVHKLDVRIGNGVFVNPGDPVPTILNSSLTVSQGSVLTGSLGAALLPYGRGSVIFTGTGTRGGFSNVQLGVLTNPIMQSGPSGPPDPSAPLSFFFSPGGTASLQVNSGARVSVGSYRGAFSQWQQPDTFRPAFFSANGGVVSIDSTSAITIGSYANEAVTDFRNGAMVVGPSGYLLGNMSLVGGFFNEGGIVSPGFSPGSMTVDGDFLMESGTLILEVLSNSSGGYDVIQANSITITGGKIVIRAAAGYVPGPSFFADFFNTTLLTIGAGVVIEIDPSFAGSSFDPATGMFSVVGGSAYDLDSDGLDDRLEAVLPAAGATQLEWPSWKQPIGSSPVLTFRRRDSAVGSYNIVVQWSSDLSIWHDIAIPNTSAGVISITANGDDPDTIELSLPVLPGVQRRFARLAVTSSNSPPAN
jgi:hypothetical protein